MARTVLAPFAFVLAATATSGQTNTAPTHPPSRPAAAVSTFLSKPLDLSLETLGPRFIGHDIVAVIRELAGSPLNKPKSEFETTVEYTARIKRLMDSRERRYTFVLNAFLYDDAAYDADREIMTAKVEAHQLFLFDASDSISDRPALELTEILRSKGAYVGKNAFGVSAQVTRTVTDEFGLALLDDDDELFSQADGAIGDRSVSTEIEMPANEAKLIKPFLRFALVCTLDNPTVYTNTDTSSATISNPREVKVLRHYILVRPDELWVYDARSGNVLSKFNTQHRH